MQNQQLTYENSTKEQRLEEEIKNLQARIDSLQKTKKNKEKALARLREEKKNQAAQSSPELKALQEQNALLLEQVKMMQTLLANAGFPKVENPKADDDAQKSEEEVQPSQPEGEDSPTGNESAGQSPESPTE
jgi:seryl-tRNA synthetase